MSELCVTDLESKQQQTNSLEPVAALVAVSALLSACGGGGESNGVSTLANTSTGTSGGAATSGVIPILTMSDTRVGSDAEAARFLAQSGFGGGVRERQALITGNIERWLGGQFALPQGQSRWDEAAVLQTRDPASYVVAWEQPDNLLWKRIVAYPDTLRQRVTLALSEIFVITAVGTDIPATARTQALMAYVDMLENNAFGNFRQLLESVTLSLQMGRMLGTLNNLKEDAATNRKPDENFAREVMQLFTIGLYELNTDGTNKLDAQGKPIETYTPETVSNLARVFTGWTYPVGADPAAAATWRQPMRMNAINHSRLEKVFLGTSIAAGTDGVSSLKTALDTLFNHANVGPFIGRQLIQRLVKSNPSPAYIARVAAAFANNGMGIRGDMKTVVSAILLDPEARATPDAASAVAGKWSEPIVRLGTLIRAFKFTSPDGQWRMYKAMALGQVPLKAPSVFNFFRPGYTPPNSVLASQSLAAPELQIVSEQTVVAQINFFTTLLTDPGLTTYRTYLDAAKAWKSDPASSGLSLDLSNEVAMATDIPTLLEHLNLLLAAGQLSANSKQIISGTLGRMSATDSNPTTLQTKLLNRVKVAIVMVMVAPESQLLL